MEFKLKANITFEAKNIDDALRSLAQHFINVSNGTEEEESFFNPGEIEIYPISK